MISTNYFMHDLCKMHRNVGISLQLYMLLMIRTDM